LPIRFDEIFIPKLKENVLLPDSLSHHVPALCGTACAQHANQTLQQASLTRQMQEFFTGLFNTDNWPPRWHCGTWTDFHGWLYLLSDVGIWAAYFAIPLLLIILLRKRSDIPFHKIFSLFIAFILLCGLTHLVDAATFWWPVYRFNALLRFITAVVSISTVFALYKVLPMIFRLRTIADVEAEMEKRRIIEEKLAASEFLLSEAGRISRVGGWDVDLVNNKRSWSKSIYDIYELPYDENIDAVDTMQFFVEPSKQMMANAINNARTKGEKWDLELMMNKPNGQTIWVRSIGEPLYNDEGKLIKLRGVFMDIDKYKSNEIALNKSLELITQNHQQLKSFTHILSHNIRNHASNISLISSLVNLDTLDEDNADLLTKMQNISTGLNTTLDDLSEAIKIKNATIKSETLHFAELSDKVMEIVGPDIATNAIEVNVRYDVQTVTFPALYLESIILNLVSNAIKYRNTSKNAVIQLSTYKNEQGYTIFECRDNGMGIDLRLHGEKIFGLYKTFHDRKDARGVGLFLVKTQIESQGGHIMVDSKPGEGTTFKIIFNEKD
jgi:signal transduction histidine kinase